jgi:hypothetical protein
MVTLDHVKAFAQGAGGSLSGALKRLGSMKNMPRDLTSLAGNNSRESLNSVGLPTLSPTERRQAKLRLYGIADNA